MREQLLPKVIPLSQAEHHYRDVVSRLNQTYIDELQREYLRCCEGLFVLSYGADRIIRQRRQSMPYLGESNDQLMYLRPDVLTSAIREINILLRHLDDIIENKPSLNAVGIGSPHAPISYSTPRYLDPEGILPRLRNQLILTSGTIGSPYAPTELIKEVQGIQTASATLSINPEDIDLWQNAVMERYGFI